MKADDLIEAICDEKVISAFTNKLQEKLSSDLYLKVDQKLNELMAEIKNNLKTTIMQVSTEVIKDALAPCYQKIIN